MATVFNNAQVQLSSTSETFLYQCTTATTASVIMSCLVANADGTNSADITLKKYNSSDTLQSTLALTLPVAGSNSLELVANRWVLKSGEKLKVTASASNRLHVTLSAMELS